MKTLSYKDKEGNIQQIGMFNINTPEVVQSTGQSTKEVMSQKAVTDELEKKANIEEVAEIISKQNSIEEWKDKLNELKYCSGLGGISTSATGVSIPVGMRSFDGSTDIAYYNAHFPIATSSTAGIIIAADKVKLDNAQSRTEIVVVTGESLSAEIGKYYRFDEPVETLEIALPQVEYTNYIVSFKAFFTTGSVPQITINGNGTDVRYFKGFSIQANTTYELDIMFNGNIWIVASAKVLSYE